MKQILSDIYTTQDIKITEILKNVENLLRGYLNEERTLHLDWKGAIIEINLDGWESLNPGGENFEKRREEILMKLNAGAIQKSSLPEDSADDDEYDLFDKALDIVDKYTDVPTYIKLKYHLTHPVKPYEPSPLDFKPTFDWNPIEYFYFWAYSHGKHIASVSDTLGRVYSNLFKNEPLPPDSLINEFNYRIQLNSIFLFAGEDMELLSEILAKYHFFKKENSSYNSHADRLKKAADTFDKEFGKLPIEYIGGKHKFSAGLGTAFLRMFSRERLEGMEQAEHYQSKESELIISASAYFEYKLMVTLFLDSISFRFGNAEPVYNFFVYTDEEEPVEIIVRDLMSIIQFRIEMLHNNIGSLLDKAWHQYDTKGLFVDNVGFAEYLLKYYKDLLQQQSPFHLPIFHQIKLPQKINLELGYCLIILIQKYLNQQLNKSELLVPSQFESVTFAPSLQRKLMAIFEKCEKPHKSALFTPKKIYWPKEKIAELEFYFSQLYKQRNTSGEFYMTEEAVRYILLSNFSCYSSNLQPVLLGFSGMKKTLSYFVYKVYEFQGTEGNPKSRFAQLLVQNFEIYHTNKLTKSDFVNLTKNIKNESARNEIIKMESYEEHMKSKVEK